MAMKNLGTPHFSGRSRRIVSGFILIGTAAWVLSGLWLGCGRKQPEPEATSLFGKPLRPVELPRETRDAYEANLARARADYEADPDDADNIIWLGRRTAYLWRYREAITIYTEGIRKFPNDARFYRHRGHRYITLRKFGLAIRDLQKAASIMERKPDEIEPDGLPNKANIPTSTLYWNVWYHLGLAYYLSGDFERARLAFNECLKITKNDDTLVAATDWLYMTYRRLGKPLEAIALLNPIKPEMNLLENFAYHKRLILYKGLGLVSADSLLNGAGASDLDLATQGYGVGNFYYYSGFEKEGIAVFRRVLQGKYWPAFGYIAAEADLKRIEANQSN